VRVSLRSKPTRWSSSMCLNEIASTISSRTKNGTA
jgi:hypothetical protein